MYNKTFIQTPIYLVTHSYVKITLFINKIHMIEYMYSSFKVTSI